MMLAQPMGLAGGGLCQLGDGTAKACSDPDDEVQILISICSTLQQVEAFLATIINSFGHLLMKIRINVLGVEFRILQHCNDLFQLSSSPPWETRSIIVCT